MIPSPARPKSADPLAWMTAAPPVRTRLELASSVWLAALTIAGAGMMLRVPAAELRDHAGGWLLTLAACGFGAVGAEAMFQARPWRYRATALSLVVALPVINGWVHATTLPLPVLIVRFVLVVSTLALGMSPVYREVSLHARGAAPPSP